MSRGPRIIYRLREDADEGSERQVLALAYDFLLHERKNAEPNEATRPGVRDGTHDQGDDSADEKSIPE